jgi:large subunit ribosomal protein L29
MKFAEMKSKSADELKGMVADLKKEKFNLRFQAATGEAVTAARWRQIRKEVARALTLINQKKDK